MDCDDELVYANELDYGNELDLSGLLDLHGLLAVELPAHRREVVHLHEERAQVLRDQQAQAQNLS